MSRTDDPEVVEGEEEYEYGAPPPRPRRTRPTAGPPRSSRPHVAPARRPPPYRGARTTGTSMVVGFMAAVIVGLLGIILFLLLPSLSPAASPAAVAPAAANAGGSPPTSAPAAPDGSTPPRMPLAEFKALYDTPAKRPLIVDVRAADVYATGHIVGAVNIPEADLDTRYKEIPKDRLVIAYCQ